MKRTLFMLILVLLKLGLCQNVGNTNNDEVKEILEFLRQGEEQLKPITHKEIVFVVGPTGTGKSTLVHFLAGNPSFMRSIASDEDSSDDFIIEHLYEDKIGNVTFQSKTIYPDLVIDQNNVPYYDCPGFSDTRTTSIEIATTYFTKKVISNADRLKLVFVVNFNSMMRGTSSRKDFAEFAEHATEFLRDVKMYKTAIILVASKVPAQTGGDVKSMNKIRSFLKEYRKFIVDQALGVRSSGDGDTSNQLALIDIFLSDRIILFKRPQVAGLLSRLPEMMENREDLRDSINEKINFVPMNDEDFGYTLSDRSKLKINALAEEINQRITNLFGQISGRVMEHYSNRFVNFNDIIDSHNELNTAIETLSQITMGNNDEFMSGSAMASFNQLNIPNVQTILFDFNNHMDYIGFLEKVQDAPITKRTSAWVGALRSCIDYLVKEKNWFSFAETLWHHLSEYDVQKDVSKYDVANIDRWGLGDHNLTSSGIVINAENFKNFLRKFMTFEMVKDAEPTTSKIDLLNSVLETTIKSRPTHTCHNDAMTVKGNFVKISDLENYQTLCRGRSVKLIEVFGLSTIFFDSVFMGNVDLVLIAPKWNIVDAHARITLNGANGNSFDDSIDGNPGLPGENANHFFGYAQHVVNAHQNFTITAVGGNGSRGQNGSTGADGKNIEKPEDGIDSNPPYTKIVSHVLDSKSGFFWFNRKKWEHDTLQSYAHCPSINGIGGSGGFGGFGGTIVLNEMAGIQTITKDGENGDHGSPGNCGKIYDKVELYKTKTTSCTLWIFCRSTISWKEKRFSDATCIQNCRNSTLVNVIGILKPKANTRPNFALSIGQYKSFVRERLHEKPTNAKFVSNFLREMEQDSNIRAIYDTASFIDDFFQIENQFHALKNGNDESSMVYFYQSLLERIAEYVSNQSHKLQTNERRILATVYTAGLSKICKIRSGTEQNLIIDIDSYLDVAIEHISLMEKRGKQVVLNQFKNEYRRNLESKIDDNRDIVTTDIMPAIAQLSSQIDTEIEDLLAKAIDEKNSVALSHHRYDQMRRQLKKLVIPRGIINFVEIVANIVRLFTGLGTVVGKTLNTMDRFAFPFTTDEHPMTPDTATITAPDELEDNYYKLENLARFAQNKKSKSLLTVVNEILEMASGFSFGDFLNSIKLIQTKLMDDKRVDLESEEIDLLRSDVQNIIQKKAVDVKTKFPNETKLVEQLHKVSKKLSVIQLDVDMFSKLSSNDEKLYEYESAMRQSYTKLLELNRMHRGLQQSIMPMVQQMQKLLNDLPTQMIQKPSLDAFKWRIQNILKTIRNQMQQFGSVNWKLNGWLWHVLDKLDGAISTLCNIFDRMQIYEDQVRLSAYIANIHSADFTLATTSTTSSSRDVDSLNRLNAIIESNILLTIFGNALNAFKQTVFPFADFYLRRFDLPPQLETETDLKTLVRNATDELVNLKLTLKEYHSASINAKDNLIHKADFSTDFTSSKPFYVWTGVEHRDMLVKLLSGRNITVKPDITMGPKLNAVKFQYLQIQLKSSNEKNQANLDKILKNFDVTIVHHGNSYYRCDDKFYLITSPTQRIEYSFEKDSNGHPIRGNNVFHKMTHGDYVLSPYALLTISLSAPYPEQFKNFDSHLDESIDLELTGRGQYLNPDVNACVGLEKYYAADEALADDIQSVYSNNN